MLLMATIYTHAFVGLGMGKIFTNGRMPFLFWLLTGFLPIVPDLDAFSSHAYGSIWGHRGFTHSIVFAALLAGAIVALGFRQGTPGLPPGRMWVFLFLATVSHGLLDMLTDGGLGVALLAPFDNRRLFCPFQPIEVASFGVGWLFTHRGAVVLASELRWVWLPSAALAAVAWVVRRA